MVILITIVHIIVCLILVVVVLLQSGKAADLAGAFGGMGSQTAFGPRGAATALSNATTIAATLCMTTSLSLAILATRGAGRSSSVLERTQKAAPVQKSTPAGTPPPAATPAAPAQAAPGDGIKPGEPYVELTPENGGPTR